MNKINNEDVWKKPIDPKTGSITIGAEFNYNPTFAYSILPTHIIDTAYRNKPFVFIFNYIT